MTPRETCLRDDDGPPNTRVQRTRSSPSALRSPLTRLPLGGRRLMVAVGISCMLLQGSAIASERHCGRDQIEKALDALVALKGLGEIYIEDGAADGTIAVPEGETSRDRMAAVDPILMCSGKAAPVLIAHVDDTRLTSALFKGGAHRRQPIRVPVGFVCLDLLLNGLSPFDSAVRDPATENDDGLGMGFLPQFYFRPDSYKIGPGGYRPLPVVYNVKKQWEEALAQGKLQFRHEYWKESSQ